MVTHTNSYLTDLRAFASRLPLNMHSARFRLRGSYFIVACTAVVFATAVSAQQPKAKPTLIPGSKAELSSITGADWIQGEGPTAFEPGKVYVFECWATWCPPCIELIPHVNELHKKYYDQGLRVYGMSSWEEDREKVKQFVKAKGTGMSYPVAYTTEGSAFETEWLKAAGVKSIPHAFVVTNGQLLLATEASRLTDSLIEAILSGDEGAQQAAAKIKSAYDTREKTDQLTQEIFAASRKKDVNKMAEKLQKLETMDPSHPELSKLKLQLLVARQDWTAATATLNKMPASYSKSSFLMQAARQIANGNAGDYPTDFTKAVTIPYSEHITEKGKAIGPNHFAYLSILYWRIGDKQTAVEKAEKGVEVAIHFARASEFRTNAFKRFANSVKEGTMPKFSDLMAWQITAKKEAEAAKKKAPPTKS